MTAFKNTYLKGAIAFAIMIVVNFVLWRLLFAPNGTFKLFTPLYGLSLIALFMFAILFFSDIYGFRNEDGRFGRGIVLLGLTTVLFWVVYYGFFWNILGKFGITYFSPQALIDTGGTGQELWNARENSSLAILYMATALIWVSHVWNAGMGDTPWDGMKRRVIGTSKFFATSFIAVIVYAIFYHPNVTALFVPRQIFAGVTPWWQDIAMTASSFYHLGWMFAGLFIIMFLVNSFGSFPFNLIRGEKSGSLLGLFAAVLIAVVGGFVFMHVAQMVMNHFWHEPFTGGNYTDDPRFRYLHTAEIAAFLMLGLAIINVFFNNVVQTSNKILNYGSRLIAVPVAGTILYLFYYSDTIGPKFVDRVPGIGNMDETSLAWTLMSLTLVLVYEKFFSGSFAKGQT